MVLVDSSIWIDYFKNDYDSPLTQLIIEDLAVTNQIILCELIPRAEHLKEQEIVEGLFALERIPMDIDWEGLRLIQSLNIKKGINNVGLPDLMIVQQAIQNKVSLWSYDKHFRLMAEHMDFDLFTDDSFKNLSSTKKIAKISK